MDKQPTFAERTELLKNAALRIKSCAELVLLEAQRMEAAGMRFAQKVKGRKPIDERA